MSSLVTTHGAGSSSLVTSDLFVTVPEPFGTVTDTPICTGGSDTSCIEPGPLHEIFGSALVSQGTPAGGSTEMNGAPAGSMSTTVASPGASAGPTLSTTSPQAIGWS